MASHPGMGSLNPRMFITNIQPHLGLGAINSVYFIEIKCSKMPLLNLLEFRICLAVVVLSCS